MTAPRCAGQCPVVEALISDRIRRGSTEAAIRLELGMPPQTHTEAPTTAEPSTVYHPPRYPTIPAPDDPETWCLP